MSAGQALFLVGGRGTRLGDLTADIPKPLLPVSGRPFIEHLLDKAVREGFDDLILLAGYRHEAVEAYAGRWCGVPLRVSVEPAPLDTAGAIAHARVLLAEQFLVVNGDTWFDFDWSSLRLLAGVSALIAARHVAPADRYETLDVVDDRVVGIRRRADVAAGLINGGVYRMRRESFVDIKGRASLEQDVLPSLCSAGALAASIETGNFIDIGLPSSLAGADHVVGPRKTD